MGRHFTLSSFARHLAEMELKVVPAVDMAAKAAADEMYKEAYHLYGDTTHLAPLAEATQKDRVAKGYSPNDPLLRNGELLRASLEKDSNAEGLAGIGSAEPIQKYHEQGYINARTGRAVPPRSVLRLGLSSALPAVREIVNGCLSFITGITRHPRLSRPSGVLDEFGREL